MYIMFPLYQIQVQVIRQIVKGKKCLRKRVYAKERQSKEAVNAKKLRLDKVAEQNETKKASETVQSVSLYWTECWLCH